MNARWRFAAGIAAVGLGIWLYRMYFPSDEQQIRAILNKIAERASEAPEPNPVARLAQAASLVKFFSEDVTIEAGSPEPRIEGREALMAIAARMRPSGERVKLEFLDVGVRSIELPVAHVTATAKITRTGPGQDADARELDLGLRKLDGVWVIASVRMVEVLGRP